MDTLFWAGHSATPAAPLLAAIQDAHERDVHSAKAEFSRRRAELRAEFRVLGRRRAQAPEEEVRLRAELGEVQEQVRETEGELRSRRAALLDAHAALAVSRAGYGIRNVQERAHAEAQLIGRVSDSVAAANQARDLAERRMLAGELARRQAAQPGLDEWVTRQQQRHEELRRQADRQARVVEEARSSGITQRVAGFLVWAGYLGMAAFGWRLGEVLHARASAAGTVGLIQFLSQESFQTFVQVGLWQGLTWIGALALLGLVAAPVIFAAFDRVLTRFDPRWNPTPEGGDGARRARPRRTPDGDAEARGADLTWDSVVSTLHGKVDRNDYRKHLARLPLIGVPVLMGMVVLVFLAQGRTSLQTASLPLNSLMFLFVGIAAAAMGSGVLCLLVAAGMRTPETTVRPFRVLAGLGVLGAAVLAWSVAEEAGWARTGPWDETALAGPLFLLLANGLMLAHGLVYNNLYRDWTALRRAVTDGEERMRDLQPHTLLGVGDLAPTALHQRWTDLYRTLDDVWRTQDAEAPLASAGDTLGGAVRDGDEDVPADQLLTSTAVTRLDERMSPELAVAVTRARSGYGEAAAAQREVARRRHGLLSRIGELNGDALARRMAEVRREAAAAEVEAAASIARLNTHFAAMRAEAQAAYATGELLRERERALGGNPVLQAPTPHE